MSEISPSKIAQVLPPYKGQKQLVKVRQTTEDIMREILDNHRDNAPYYDRIAPAFWKGNISKTCEEIFSFCKKNLPYKVEPTLSQTVKTPSAILAEAKSFGNDCKHYASFIVGICEALRRKGLPMNSVYRFACYKAGDNNPGHVFAVVKIGGREIWIDPVLTELDQRDPGYYFKVDKKPSVMALERVSGIDDGMNGTPWNQFIGKPGMFNKLMKSPLNPLMPGMIMPKPSPKQIQAFVKQHGRPPRPDELLKMTFRKRKMGEIYLSPLPGDLGFCSGIGKAKKKSKEAKKAAKAAKKEQKKARKAERKKDGPGKGRLVMKVGGAASRNAYLLMLKMNLFHLATNIMKRVNGSEKDPAWKKIADKWRKLGGNPKVLWKNIVQGTRVYNKKKGHKNKVAIKGFGDIDDNYEMGGVYIEPTEFISGYEDIYSMSGIDEDQDISGIGVVTDDAGNIYEVGALPEFHDNYTMAGIGVAPAVGLAAILAAAAPIIAAMKSILGSLGIKSDKSAEASMNAQEQIVNEHNAAADNPEQVNKDGVVSHDEGVAETKVTTDPQTGADVLNVNVPSQEGPGNEPGSTESGQALPPEVKDKGDGGQGITEGFNKAMDNIKEFFSKNKTPIMIGAGVIGLAIVVPRIIRATKGGPKRRR